MYATDQCTPPSALIVHECFQVRSYERQSEGTASSTVEELEVLSCVG